MKKSYVYFIAPLVGVALFGAVYWKYDSEFEAKEAAANKKIRDDKEAKILKENESKKKAVEDAIAAQEKRKKEKAEKDAKDQKERDDRDRAVQVRNKAKEEARKLADRVKTIAKEVEDNKKEIDRLTEEKKRSIDEQNFLKEHVKKSEANVQALYGVLEKIEAADKAAEAAAKAAELAAKAAAAKK